MPGVLVDSSSHAPLPFESFLDATPSYADLSLPSATPYNNSNALRHLPRSKLGIIGAADSPHSESAVGMFQEYNQAAMASPRDVFAALQRYLPSNREGEGGGSGGGGGGGAMDGYTCDEFRMYEFKVRRCMRGRSHDWTECPFAHPGEKARRRDPRRFHYSGAACPEFRKGVCKKGDACEYAHGVFECWLHPARYRTQPCKDGRACRRRVCFFAHSVQQLRILPSPSSPPSSPSSFSCTSATDDFSPSPSPSSRSLLLQQLLDHGYGVPSSSTSPTSTLLSPHSPPLSPSSSSPPLSPDTSLCRARTFSSAGPSQCHSQSPLSIPLHRRHLNRLHSIPTIAIPPSSADLAAAELFEEVGLFAMSPSTTTSSSNAGDLAGLMQALQLRGRIGDLQRAVNMSATSSPEGGQQWRMQSEGGLYAGGASTVVGWASLGRVESGSALRANFYGKIGKDNGVGVAESSPDFEWVSNLLQD